MCGFAGFLSGAWPGDAAPLRLKAMTDAIAHRGPDSEGQWLDADAAIALGHRRLSIVELSVAGAQCRRHRAAMCRPSMARFTTT